MSANVLKIAKRIESERRRIEYNGVRSAAYQGQLACLRAKQAVRLGHSPIDAAKAVLMGNKSLGYAGIFRPIGNAMLMAHLRGMRRTILQAEAHGVRIDKASMSRMDEEQKRERQRQREEETLLLLLYLDDSEVEAMRSQYQRRAEAMLSKSLPELTDRLESVAARMRWGGELKIPEGLKEVSEEFARSGFLPSDPYAISNMISRGVVSAYESGRWDGWKIPQIKDVLWGFRYVAVLDDRTTELCRSLSDMTAPADDPVWISWTPPNHFFCRSMLTEIWKAPGMEEPDIVQPKATPDDIEKFRAMKAKFLRYQ